ncbi:MAG: winged helix-turn-helix transcriptional regulator [Limnochordaceae bacterium]|nr:winged helix-turn-helix transcriptional regulator [Limnochordaceae bacterium]
MLADYEAVMKAAGDRTRARILKMLQGRELCVCQLMAVLRMSSSTVSKHLSILKMTGLVQDRRDGRWVYYSLVSQTVDSTTPSGRNPYVGTILRCLQDWLNDDPAIRADQQKLEKLLATPVEQACGPV